MKYVRGVLLCSLFLFGVLGCESPWPVLGPNGRPALEDIAGTWQAEDSPWKIVLTPQGTVESAFMEFGRMEIKPQSTEHLQGWRGEPGVINVGSCPVSFDPKTGELTVEIVLDYFSMAMGNQLLQGRSTEVFRGPVSPDGLTWQATQYTGLDAFVLERDPNDPANPEKFREIAPLDTNPNVPADELIFKKLQDPNQDQP